MHRLVMGAMRGQLVQFRNHDFYDLRKSQLRIATQSEVNQRMRKTAKPTASDYKGVTFEERGSKGSRWIAQAHFAGRVHKIKERTGNDPQAEIVCARAYDCLVLANFDNPNPNFPATDYSTAEITAYKVTAKPIIRHVCAVKPSPNVHRIQHRKHPRFRHASLQRSPVVHAHAGFEASLVTR